MNFKNLLTGAFLAATCMGSYAQKSVKQDREAIKEMCGCYEVEFKYAETFSDATDYQLHDPYSSKGLEWIFVDEEDSTHFLVFDDNKAVATARHRKTKNGFKK